MASGPLNRATNSGEAADTLLVIAKAGRRARQLAEGVQSLVVHTLDLPSHRDIERLDAKVERLQRAIDELSAADRDRELRR